MTHTATHFADTDELGCGELMMALMKAVKPLEPGQILDLHAADSGAKEDIPAWCNMTGHKLLAAQTGDDCNHYLIQKKEN
jgi:tRNA 2-thiouridine synthesizing protein A